MSATNRPKKSGPRTRRRDNDFYATPAWCVERLLDQGPALPAGNWLEPSAGSGNIIRAVEDRALDVRWTAVEVFARIIPELRETQAHVIEGNFLNPTIGEQVRAMYHDVALGNPPYLLAVPFILQALNCAEQVVFLLRLNFLGSSRKRQKFFEHAGVPDVYVLARRPSFTGGGTDACEYAWMRWIRGRRQKSEVKILWEPEGREES